MMSPDRKWVWDGSQWLPVADPSAPAHTSVFPGFNGASSDLPLPVATAQPMPVQIPYSVRSPAPQRAQPNVPRWDRPQTGLNKYLYIAAGAIVVVIGIGLVVQFGLFTLPGRATPSTPVVAQATPGLPPLTDRSDSARADRYLKSILAPPLAAMNDTSGPVELGCHGSLTVGCASALPPMDRELKHMLSVIDATKAAVPACIALNISNIRRDVAAMTQNLEGMQNASDENNSVAVKKDYLAYEAWRRLMLADLPAATSAQQTVCEPVVSGP